MVFDAAAASASASASAPPTGSLSSPDHSTNAVPGAMLGSTRSSFGGAIGNSGSGYSNAGGTGGGGSGGVGSGRRPSVAHGASFRGLLSIFDNARSPLGEDSSGGGVAAAGGGGGGGGASRRWGNGRRGRRRGSSAGRARRSRGGGSGGGGDADASPLGIGTSWHGRSARGRGGPVEFGSPVRRHSLAEPTSGGLSSSVGSFRGDGGGWSLEGYGGSSAGATGVTDYHGDYVGGGHALCRSRSRCVVCGCVVVPCCYVLLVSVVVGPRGW